MKHTKKYKLVYYFWNPDNQPLNISPMIDVVIKGSKFRFLVDTGSTLCFMDENSANYNKVKTKPHKKYKGSTIKSLNGRYLIEKEVFCKDIKIEGEKAAPQKFYVIKLNSFYKNLPSSYDGVVGFNFIIKNKLEFDFLMGTFSIGN